MANEPDWPLADEPRLAWAPPGDMVAGAVPIAREHLSTGLTRARYAAHLCARVAWMMVRSDMPAGATVQLAAALEEAGLWDGPGRFQDAHEAAFRLLDENSAWQSVFFADMAQLQDDEPWPIENNILAVRTVGQTPIWEWLERAIPGFSDGPWEMPLPAQPASPAAPGSRNADAPATPHVGSTDTDPAAKQAAAQPGRPDQVLRTLSCHFPLVALAVAIGFGLVALYVARIDAEPAGPTRAMALVTDRWTGVVWLCPPNASQCMRVYPPSVPRRPSDIITDPSPFGSAAPAPADPGDWIVPEDRTPPSPASAAAPRGARRQKL